MSTYFVCGSFSFVLYAIRDSSDVSDFACTWSTMLMKTSYLLFLCAAHDIGLAKLTFPTGICDSLRMVWPKDAVLSMFTVCTPTFLNVATVTFFSHRTSDSAIIQPASAPVTLALCQARVSSITLFMSIVTM